MRPVARLVQQEFGAPGDHFFTESNESLQQVLEIQLLWPPAGQRNIVHAEGALQLREAVELVENDIGHGIALDFDHHAHALARGLITNIRNAFDLLVPHHFRNALDHQRLVHLIGNFSDDQRFTVLADFFRMHPPRATQQSRAPCEMPT